MGPSIRWIGMLTFLLILSAALADPSTTETDDAGFVTSTTDYAIDGGPAMVAVFDYDDRGARVMKRFDDDGDGTIDRVFRYEPGCVTPYDACSGRFETTGGPVATLPPVVEPAPHVPWGPTPN